MTFYLLKLLAVTTVWIIIKKVQCFADLLVCAPAQICRYTLPHTQYREIKSHRFQQLRSRYLNFDIENRNFSTHI